MEAKNLLLCLAWVTSQKHLCDPSLTLTHMLEPLSTELLALDKVTLHCDSIQWYPARIHHSSHTVSIEYRSCPAPDIAALEHSKLDKPRSLQRCLNCSLSPTLSPLYYKWLGVNSAAWGYLLAGGNLTNY